MRKKEIDSSKKIWLILMISLSGMAIASLIFLIFKHNFLFDPRDRFMDYFNTMNATHGVYKEISVGRGYFPFTYVLLISLGRIIPHVYVNYFVTVFIVFISIFIFYKVFFEKWNLCGMLAITFLSYPLIFAIDRGNIEHLVFAFLIFFFIAYKKEKYTLAAILLTFPICMKLYPAIFAILFLKDKKYKELIICEIATAILMVGSFITVGGNANNFPIAIDNFTYFTNTMSKTEMGVQFSHSIWSGLNYISLAINNTLVAASNISIYTIIIGVVSMGLVGYIVFLEKEDWKAITILTIMMITFPHTSFDYTLIHMYIPITFFILAENTKLWEGILYGSLLGLSIVPMNWFQTIIKPEIISDDFGVITPDIVLNWGLAIRPIILISLIVIIVVTALRNKKKTVEGN